MIRVFTSRNQKIGLLGESVARSYLEKNKFVIRETNYSCRFGEIDIVAFRNNMLYFYEVKTVSRESFDTKNDNSAYLPEFNVSREKIKKFLKSVQHYFSKNVSHETDLFDFEVSVISVILCLSKKQAIIRFTRNISIE